MLLCLWCAVVKNSSMGWVHQDRCFFAWKRKKSPSCVFKELDDGERETERRGEKEWEGGSERDLRLTSVVLCSLFWISWPLKMGLISCSEMPVMNYHSMLLNVLQESRSHVMIWCRSGSERSSLLWSGSALFYVNLSWAHILKCLISGKNLSSIRVNMVLANAMLVCVCTCVSVCNDNISLCRFELTWIRCLNIYLSHCV